MQHARDQWRHLQADTSPVRVTACLAQRWADKTQTQSLLVAGQTTYRWTLTLERKYFFASMNEPKVKMELSSQNQSNEDQTNR